MDGVGEWLLFGMLLVPALLGSEPLANILKSQGARYGGGGGRHLGFLRVISQCFGVFLGILTGGSGEDGGRMPRKMCFHG